MKILVDTGIWYGIFDPRDAFHEEALTKAKLIEPHTLIIPWPTMYETLCTQFVRKYRQLMGFETFLKRSRVEFLDDSFGCRSQTELKSLKYLARQKN